MNVNVKTLFFALLVFSVSVFARPTVIYTGVYSVSSEKKLGNTRELAPVFFQILAKWQDAGKLPFDLILETDAEETKHLAADPISMAFLVTRDDFEVEHFKKIGVTKTTANFGITALFYQSRLSDKGSVNTILASIPLNSYMTNEKPLTNENIEAERPKMTRKIVADLIQNKFFKRVQRIGIEEIKVNVFCSGEGCFVENYGKSGLEVGQSVSVKLSGVGEDLFVKASDGSLEMSPETYATLKKAQNVEGFASNLKGYSEETWQVVNVKITSKKAAEIFKREPIQSQMAQWYSDFLSETGKAVLPPISGLEWTQNSMGYTEMILAKADGEMESFAMAPAKYRLILGISGVASGVVEQNNVNQIWAYKLWLTRQVNKRKEEEAEYTTSKKVVVQTQEHRDVDVFRDLLHVSTKTFAQKGK